MRLIRAAPIWRGLVLGALVLLPACLAVPAPERIEGPTADFWRDPPTCVVVLPAAASGEIPAREAEHALARHLSGRVETVIGPDGRDRLTRRLAIDLAPGDQIRVAERRLVERERFAERAGCGHGAELSVTATRTFAVVWSAAQVDLALRIVDLRHGGTLWRARHRASRGAGGVPASPVGLALALGQAGLFVADRDLPASVLDDGLRALLRGLPDMRGGGMPQPLPQPLPPRPARSPPGPIP